MFNCELCGNKSGQICYMGFAVVDFCETCYRDRRQECDVVYGKVSEECVEKESKLPTIDFAELTNKIDCDAFQRMVEENDPQLDDMFAKIALAVYDLKLKNLHCNRNWRWTEEEMVKESVAFCKDRLLTYDPLRGLALDYFVAVADHVYSQAKKRNSYDWAY